MLKFAIFEIGLAVIIINFMMVFATGDENGQNHLNILEVMRSVPHFSFMVILIETAGQEILFQDKSTKRMVFVPVDNAFVNVRTDLMIHFLTDERWKLHLLYFLKHHVFHKMVDIEDGSKMNIETLVDQTVTLESHIDGGIIVNSVAKFVEENIVASNGVIQAIDNVLVPEWYNRNLADVMKLDPVRLSTLVSVSNKSVDFMDAISSSSLEPYTIFAPTNGAFSNFFDDVKIDDIPNILGYHVVPGIHTGIDLMQTKELKSSIGQLLQVNVDLVQRTLRINGNLVIQSNILANNGVLHIIDGPLVPPLNETNSISSQNDPVDMRTAVQTTERNFNFTEPRCGCSLCPVSCGARIEWLKKNQKFDEAGACTKLSTEKLLVLDCQQCDPNTCFSNPDPTTETILLREEEHNKCLFLKEIEESRGTSEVKCRCQELEDGSKISFELECWGEANISCSPKYAQCDTTERCCSNPLRRCSGGQCRDAISPQRKKMYELKLGFRERRT